VSTAIWTVLAVAVMLGGFAACVIAVAAGVRLVETVLEKRRREATR
jgi:hypothetical protein